ncbi:MAG: hypothetical protein V1740_00955 [Candidatus Woesearchaeota archaeon]
MIDFSKIKTISIKDREHKEALVRFPNPDDPFKIIENEDLRELAERIIEAYNKNKQIIFMIGGHVVKTGMSAYIVDLMKKGVINHIAMNGATSIHDFEIATYGETSEDVESGIKNGTFGMVKETGEFMNSAIKEGAGSGNGYGHAIGKKIDELNGKNKEKSVLYQAYNLGIPATVHVAIGNDTIHMNPKCDGSSLGKATYIDFKKFADTLSKADKGVIVNIGSAVILPETFLKAITIVRNLGYDIGDITTANLDMIDHYRPRLNVVERPVSALGGKGFVIIERHEKTIPSLYKLIMKAI